MLHTCYTIIMYIVYIYVGDKGLLTTLSVSTEIQVSHFNLCVIIYVQNLCIYMCMPDNIMYVCRSRLKAKNLMYVNHILNILGYLVKTGTIVFSFT